MSSLQPSAPNSTAATRFLIDRERRYRRCRTDLLTWCVEAGASYTSDDLPYGFIPAKHHRLLIENLEWLAATPNARLMVFMPPGSAKSTYGSVFFPAWWMARKPKTNVIGVSYGTTLAEDFSRKVQRIIRENSDVLGYGLTNERADRWSTTNGCSYLATGSTAAITGFRGDLICIDDPVKGRLDADSQTIRDNIWSVYLADIYSRRRPGARMLVIQTRWHEDDLSGRILANDDSWRVIKLPAYATEADDPLGRDIGEPLWADDAYGYAPLLHAAREMYQRNGATRDWESLYQQNPRPTEGALFKVGRVATLDVAPNLHNAQVGVGWDLAATAQVGTHNPDWTARVKLAKMPSGLFVVLDVFRDRGGPDDVEGWIANYARHDGKQTRISVPQDPGQAGKAQVLAFTRLLTGWPVESSVETGDKATRAAPAIAQVNGGNFAIVKGAWNAAFLDELASFPSGTKDDMVDALSRAFSIVGLEAKPLLVSADVLKMLGRR